MKRKLLRALGILVGIVALWILGGNLLAGCAERRAERRWSEAVAPMDGLPNRYKTERSGSAKRLTALAVQIGIDLAPDRVRAARPGKAARNAAVEITNRMGRVLSDPSLEVPRELPGFLSRHRAVLDGIESLLTAPEEIVWECDPERLYEAPLPPLLGQRLLHDVLLFDALEKSRRGDRAGAVRALEASLRLNASMQNRPELVSQTVAVGIAQMQIRLVERLENVPGGWAARPKEHDYRRSWLLSLEGEVWFMREAVRRKRALLSNGFFVKPKTVELDPDRDLTRALVRGWILALAKSVVRSAVFRKAEGALEAPYLRVTTANASQHLLEGALRAAESCPPDWERYWRDVGESVPWWNLAGREIVPYLGKTGEAACRHR